jgi:hypothetical protein
MFFCAIIQIGSVSIANHNLREKYVQTMAKKKVVEIHQTNHTCG